MGSGWTTLGLVDRSVDRNPGGLTVAAPQVTTDPEQFCAGDRVQVTLRWACGCRRVEHRVRLADGGWRMHTEADGPHVVEQLCDEHRRTLCETGIRPDR